MTHALRSLRLLGAIALLLAFNALALWLLVASAVPTEPWAFASLFLGDMAVGLIALSLTDRE